ncbi:unnamed protein product [Aphanomyces euteiches]
MDFALLTIVSAIAFASDVALTSDNAKPQELLVTTKDVKDTKHLRDVPAKSDQKHEWGQWGLGGCGLGGCGLWGLGGCGLGFGGCGGCGFGWGC